MRGFLPEKYFSLGIEWGIFNLKNINKIGFPPEAPREGINNLWPVGTEDLNSDHRKIIFSL